MLSSLIGSSQTKFPKSSPKTDDALSKLYKYLAGLTKSQDSGLQDIAVQEYSNVLKTKKARELFWSQREETVGPLMDILRTAVGATKDSGATLWAGAGNARSISGGLGEGVGIQLLYHVLLVIWQLSFEGSLVGSGLEEYEPATSLLPPLPLTHFSANKRSSLSTHTSSAFLRRKKSPASYSPPCSISSPPIAPLFSLLQSPLASPRS